ncbi:MAG: hypothetical protein COB12_08685 [Flavobacterium sp.]|nr:MAG: hypothetical protein COB12_08685 [Flavobacterium sp.]
MDYFNKFLFNAIPTVLLELLAALAGFYFLKKNRNASKYDKYFVVFLWYTFANEVIGAYAPIAYFSEYRIFGFIKGTLFERNYWLYNIYFIINASFLVYYFNNLLSNKKSRKITNFVLWSYVLSAIIFLFATDVYYKSYSNFTFALGAILLLISILLFYFRLLKTDEIIDLKKYLPIYLSIGVMFFYLCVTPIELFAKYFKITNEVYVAIRINLLLICNIFMYTTFIIGFIVCAKDKPNKEKRITK